MSVPLWVPSLKYRQKKVQQPSTLITFSEGARDLGVTLRRGDPLSTCMVTLKGESD